ncbi:MAG: hypothetical protein AB7U81_00790 [Thiohalomonadaceae bacterium]
MKLTIYAEGQTMPLEVPEAIITDGHAFFDKLDSDMDRGWQMSHQWVDRPDLRQRSQIVADHLLDAMHRGQVELALLLAGYILVRNPGATAVRIGEAGDMSQTEIVTG